MGLPVSDTLSNLNEQIEAAARILGRSNQAHAVFDAIYFGKKRVKTVDELAEMTGLSPKQVMTQGKKLVDNKLVKPVKNGRKISYEKIDFFYQHKRKILSLAGNREKLEEYPTKRKAASPTVITVKIDTSTARAKRISIDDIESFSKVKGVDMSGHLGDEVSERVFKKGIQEILGEVGKFSDWGGEKNDLYTTRAKVAGKRRAAAFAFKGPGATGVLTPRKMGKNADQLQRLFEADADVFLVQYHGQIGESVIDQMEKLAIAKSVMSGRDVWYVTVDGIDSKRIYVAYRDKFAE